MQEILDKLKIMNEDIKYDITKDYLDDAEREKYKFQSIQLSMAIGLLENLGQNNNI